MTSSTTRQWYVQPWQATGARQGRGGEALRMHGWRPPRAHGAPCLRQPACAPGRRLTRQLPYDALCGQRGRCAGRTANRPPARDLWRGVTLHTRRSLPPCSSPLLTEAVCVCLPRRVRPCTPSSPPKISETLVHCAAGVPTKATIYGTVVGLLNTDTFEWVAELLKQIRAELLAAVTAGEAFRCRALCRFLGVLVLTKVLAPDALCEVYTELVALAEGCQGEGRHHEGDALFSYVLAGLPLAEPVLAAQAAEAYALLVAALERYAAARPAPHASARAGCQIISGTASTLRLAVEDIWEKLRAVGGATVPPPPTEGEGAEQQQPAGPAGTMAFQHVYAAFNEHLNSSQQHRLEALGLAPADVASMQPGRWTYRLLPQKKSACGLNPLDRALMEEVVLDSLASFNGWRPELVAELVHLPCPQPHDFLLAEVLFGQMLALPRPAFPEVFYGTVMMELAKALPKSFPQKLLTTANVLFSRMSSVDVECRERLATWLAHHMSNFQFQWNWDSWMDAATEQDDLNPQRMFIEQTLGALVRLSYYEHTQKCIPKELHKLLAPDPLPAFAYGEGSDAGELCNVSVDMVKRIRARQSAADLLDWLKGEVATAHGGPPTAAMAVQTLLKMGAASLSHTRNALDRYRVTLEGVCAGRDERASAMAAVARFWGAAPQQLVFAATKMLEIGALDADAVVGWVFGAEAKEAWGKAFPWELLRSAAAASAPMDMSVDGEGQPSSVMSVLKGFKGAAEEAIAAEGGEAEKQLVLGQLRAFARRQAPMDVEVSEGVRAEFGEQVDAAIRQAVIEGLGFE